ncbi:MAG TPA: hypothetical protein VKT70_07370 [Stellaceae bacterium]|nr:hypothetical protein [Stellaceae bacterium]
MTKPLLFPLALIAMAVTALTPPTPLLPKDDPEQESCIAPNPEEGIKFTWEPLEEGSVSFIEILRFNEEGGQWANWVKKYSHSPFTLNARNPRVFDAAFAWRIWSVDPSGQSHPYASAGPWHLFCTLPAGH